MADAVGNTFVTYLPSSLGRSIASDFKNFIKDWGDRRISVSAGFDPQVIQTASKFLLRTVIRIFTKGRPPKSIHHEADTRTIKAWLGYLEHEWHSVDNTGQAVWNWTESAVMGAIQHQFEAWMENAAESLYEDRIQQLLKKNVSKISDRILKYMEEGVKTNAAKIQDNWAELERRLNLEKRGGWASRLIQRVTQYFKGQKYLTENELMDVVVGNIDANATAIKKMMGDEIISPDVNIVLDSFNVIDRGKVHQAVDHFLIPLVSAAVDPHVPTQFSELSRKVM